MSPRSSALNSALLVVDVQDRLLAVMPDAAGLVRDVGFLLDVANLLQVPDTGDRAVPAGARADQRGTGPPTAPGAAGQGGL